MKNRETRPFSGYLNTHFIVCSLVANLVLLPYYFDKGRLFEPSTLFFAVSLLNGGMGLMFAVILGLVRPKAKGLVTLMLHLVITQGIGLGICALAIGIAG